MRWKWNLAFNNDDGKKNYTLKNYLQKIIYIKKIIKTLAAISSASCFPVSMSCSEIEIK